MNKNKSTQLSLFAASKTNQPSVQDISNSTTMPVNVRQLYWSQRSGKRFDSLQDFHAFALRLFPQAKNVLTSVDTINGYQAWPVIGS